MSALKRLWQFLLFFVFRRPGGAAEKFTAAIETAPEQLFPPPVKAAPSEPRDFSYHHLRRDLAEQACYVLERFEHLRQRPNMDLDPEDIVILEELWGCDFLLLDPVLGRRMKGADKWSAIDGVRPDELANVIWPFDYAFARVQGKSVELNRFTTVEPKDVRGVVDKIFPKMVKICGGSFTEDGNWHCCYVYLGLVGERWRLLHTLKYDTVVERNSWANFATSVLPSILTARYEWHVAFGTIDGGPRLLFPTNPKGALKLFRNRELPEGQARRSALKHWVAEHWREDDKSGLEYVCNHLRGQTRFTWSEFDCELFVGAYDLEKNEFFKHQAAEWRAQRKHNRVRLHSIRRKPVNVRRPA